MRLLVLPAIAAITTFLMTYLEYEETPMFHEYLEEKVREKLLAQGINATIDTEDMFWKLDPAKDFLVSSCINNPTPEQWSGFVARWVLWHTTLFFIVECKLEILPRPLMWLPILWGLTLISVIWSGIHQFENFRYQNHYGDQRMIIHIGCAFIAFFICWFEAVTLWCPNRVLHVLYGVLVFSFFLIAKVPLYAEIVEWLILIVHLVVVWYNYNDVDKQIKDGKWKPWVGCCHWCCPSLQVTNQGGYCCPPPGGECCCLSSAEDASDTSGGE